MILVTGARGQLGRSLQETKPLDCGDVHFFGRDQLDLSKPEQVESFFTKNKVTHIINCAACTAVDLCEEKVSEAEALNSHAVKHLAGQSKKYGAKMIHISTDYVFDGTLNKPYTEKDETRPLNIYGQSKLEGENEAFDILADDLTVIRTSWLYSKYQKNFVKTILNLLASKENLNVISDQKGSPTWAKNLAGVVWQTVLSTDVGGLFHFSDKGVTSWFDFAHEIQNKAFELEMIDKKIPINAVNTSDYKQPAERPPYSELDSSKLIEKLNIEQIGWEESLGRMLLDFKKEAVNE